MKFAVFSGVLAIVFGFSPLFGQGGLDEAAPIGRFLNGALPPQEPRPATGSYQLVNAFPDLTFIDPVEMQPVPYSNRLVVLEKVGRLSVFENNEDADEKTVLFDIRGQVESSHDSGMVGLAFHPEFGNPNSPNRHYLYIYYRYTPNPSERNKAYCRLSRFTWDPGTDAIATSSELVLINQYDRHNWHNGGGIFFGNDGFLYVSIGDEGGANDQYNSGQEIDQSLLAGVLRIDVDQDASRSHPIRRQPLNPATPPSGWPDSYTQGYYIPNDNPWLNSAGSTLEEFYAIGLRSPHRMTIDRPTGKIWVGDVGQNSREEVSTVVKGANLQWPYKEGAINGPKTKPTSLIGTDQPPAYSYGRSIGTCVIGGFVYRGSLHPELQGKYLFGDHGSSRIWSLDDSQGGAVVNQLLTLSRHGPGPKNGLGAFGYDASGEIYILSLAGTDLDGGRIYRLDKSTVGIPEPPQLLSQTTAFSDVENLIPAAGVIPYDVIQPLWSDGADKQRWISIPNDGTPNTSDEQIGWSKEGHWSFPIGTVLIKHFEFPGQRLETRFFVRGENSAWYGFSYKWNEQGTDAVLLPGEPVHETITADGETFTWHYPGRNECASCHTQAAGTVLGVKSRHLNSSINYSETGRLANQIVTLNQLGFFSPAVDESILGDMLTAKSIADNSATLERRARSYIDINCSQCHQPAAPTQANFDARMEVPLWYQNLVNVVPNNNFGNSNARIITPADLSLSLLHHRVGSLQEAVAMPPIAKNRLDNSALSLLADWINSLDPDSSPQGPVFGPAPRDHIAPEISLSLSSGSSVVSGPFDVSLTASEPIEGLSFSDVSVENGTIASISGIGENWVLEVVPSQNGPGSVSFASDKVTDLNGNANPALPVPLTFDYQFNGNSDNLLTNGSFEGGLSDWDAQGDISLSSNAYTGSNAVRIGANSFVVQSFAITAQENYIYSGRFTSAGSGLPVEAGLTFWDANGVWISDRIITITPGQSYDLFSMEITVPLGSASVSLWVFTSDGPIIVDDLELIAGGNGDGGDGGGGDEPNLLTNGDFEAGLSGWDAVNQTVLTSASSSGTQAAEVKGQSFAVQDLLVTEGETLRLTGDYFSTGAVTDIEAGFSFWDANGDWITDRYLQFDAATDYTDFTVETVIPDGAVRVSVWIWNGGESGSLIADNLKVIQVGAPGINLFSNGDFETGDLQGWDNGGSNAVYSTDARSGSGAVLVNAESFLVQSFGGSEGELVEFSGYYKADNPEPGNQPELGFSFWDENGAWLGDEAIVLSNASDYTYFNVVGEVPAGAASYSAWVYCPPGCAVTVDDLSHEKITE